MTFPVVETTNTSSEGSNVETHTVNLPADIEAGDLLIVVFSWSNPAGTSSGPTFPGDWTEIQNRAQNLGATNGASTAYRWADGLESSTITCTTTGEAQRTTHTSYRISGAENPATQPPEFADAVGQNSSPTPPPLTPTGGAKDYLWIACGCSSHDGTYDAFSSGYTGGIQISTATIAAGHCICGSAVLASNTDTENPGAFDHDQAGSAEWVSVTLAIHPASAAVGGLPEFHAANRGILRGVARGVN